MSSDNTESSVFTIGDIVLANPKEAASLLTIVIFFAVCAQYLFIALRKSKVAAVRMVFNSFSNSLLTIGAISLVFSFASQAVGGVNPRWLILLRWSQVVLLTLLLELFVGTIIGTAILRKIWTMFDATEGKIPSSTYAQATASTSTSETSFFDKYTLILHIVFVKDVAFMVQSLAAAAAAAAEGRRRLSARRDALRRKLGAMLVAARERDELELQSTGIRNPDGTLKSELAAGVGESGGGNADLEATLLGQAQKQTTTPLLLSSILQNALHTQMSDLADITWLSWLMLVFLVAVNSIRMFALPGKLQSKPPSEFTLDDRTLNIFTFIGLVGWVPTVVFLFVLALFVRNFRQYTVMAHSVLTLTKDADTMGPALEAGRIKITTGAVWLPPEPRDYERHRNQRQRGTNGNGNGNDSDDDDDEYEDPSTQHQLEDPSMYFLRGNRSFTLLALRVPMLMVELYTSIFFIGMIGDVTSTFGPRLVYVIPAALLPLIIVWITIPIGAFMLACLSSMGSRLGEDDLAEAFLSSGEWRELLGDEVALDEHGVDNEYGKDANANNGNDNGGACVYCEERIDEIRSLEEKIESLEKLCKKFGLKVHEYRGSAKHSHHQEIPIHNNNNNNNHNYGFGGANNNNHNHNNTFDTNFGDEASNRSRNNNNNSTRIKDPWPTNNNNDNDLIALEETSQQSSEDLLLYPAASVSSGRSLKKNAGDNNIYPSTAVPASPSYLAPDNVQAASFQDKKHRDASRSFHQEKQTQQNNNNNHNNSYFASSPTLVSNIGTDPRRQNNNNNNNNNTYTPREGNNGNTPFSSSSGATPRTGNSNANVNNNTGKPLNIPLLSASALSTPAGHHHHGHSIASSSGHHHSHQVHHHPHSSVNNNNSTATTSAATAAVNNNNNNVFQTHGNSAMMKNIGSALRGSGM